jgi:hypothetical protein
MANDTFKYPDNVFILLILLNEIHEFVVCDYLLILIIIDRDPKLVVVIRQYEVMHIILKKFHNTGTMSLPIFPWVHKEHPTY